MATVTLRVPELLVALIATLRLLWCWIRGRHDLREWPWIKVESRGMRMRPYRQCRSCGAIAATEQGRLLLVENPNDDVAAQLRARPLIWRNA